MKKAAQNQGFLRFVLVIVAIILILGYFNIDLKKTIESPTNQQNAAYVKSTSTTIWTKYLEKPATYLWNSVFINLLWNSFVSNLERIRDGQPTQFEANAPTVGV